MDYSNIVADTEMVNAGHHPEAGPANSEGSRASTPLTIMSATEDPQPSTNSKKRKQSEEPLLASARTTRSRRQTPSKAGSSTAAAFNSRKKGKSPAGPLSIFIPPSNGQIPETSHNAMSSKATSPALDSDLALAADADSIRREAAAGYESRLRARQPGNAKRDGGQRMGVSASGRDVRIGGSTRQAAQQSKKDKGKGKSDVQPNQDFCSACRGIGRFLCCDGCPRSFHFMCLEPPLKLDELPSEEMWLCKQCRSEKAKAEGATLVKESEIPAVPAVFRAICKKIEEENPEQFRLPADVRKYFAGVATGADGEYVDSKEARTKIDRKGFLEDRDPFRLRDGRQRKVECYHCGGSALPKHSVMTDPEATWRQIVSCDYCSLSWHLDCLSPPPTIMPSAGKKWMCPNHPDHVMPRRRTLQDNIQTIEVVGKGQFNNGNVEIVNDSGSSGTSEMEFEDTIINRRKFRVPEKIIRLDFWEKLKKERNVIQTPAAVQEEINADEQDAQEAIPPMEDLNAAAMMMALAFSRHTHHTPPAIPPAHCGKATPGI
ncbi:nuclear protein [Cryptococcus neoformans Tu401-1]|nr:hypothetical protein AYX15_05438 [Cryptococcus neoformans var. grubii]OWZ77084.1 nuclear protein [Cryptococcus neoformans var. grubii Bt85]OXG14586.1 nuclear protein [Cryptococcus neoformans var. grubii Tu401-1]